MYSCLGQRQNGNYIKDYSHESGEWALEYDKIKKLKEYDERLKEDGEKTQQRLENIREAIANYEQMFAVLKAE